MAKNSVAKKNDLYRANTGSCRVVLTERVACSDYRIEILAAVRNFVRFTDENDPWSEHDFGFVEVGGERWFFKFDYYDANYEFYQEDGNRVLTIGHASEY